MTSPPYLASLVCAAGGQVKVGRLVDGHIFTQIGGDVGTDQRETVGYVDGPIPTNYVAKFNGELYTCARDKIYKYNLDTDAWDVVYTYPSWSSVYGGSSHTGLYVVEIDGTNCLCQIGYNAATVGVLLKFDGTTWTNTTLTDYPGYNLGVAHGHGIIFQNVLFWSIGAGVAAFDFSRPSYRVIGIGQGSTGEVFNTLATSFFVLKNRLYMIGQRSSDATLPLRIWRYDVGYFRTLQLLTDVVPYVGPQADYRHRPISFTVGDTAYAFNWGSTVGSGSGSRLFCLKMTLNLSNTFDVVDISSTVFAGTRLASLAATFSYCTVWSVAVDSESDPANPDVDLWFAHAWKDVAGQVWEHYKWNGENPLTYGGMIGSSYGYAMPNLPLGAASAIWTKQTLGIMATTRREPTVGGMKYTFKAYGDPTVLYHGTVTGTFVAGAIVTGSESGATATIVRVNSTAKTLEVGGVSVTPFVAADNLSTPGGNSAPSVSVDPTGGGADYSVKLYHSTNQGTPTTPSSLTGNATGGSALRVGNQVNGIKADEVTTYTCVWDFETDLVDYGQGFTDLLRIFKTP